MTSLLDISPVLPVVVVDDVATAVPLARALADGGVPVVEVTLRSDAALDAIRAIVAEVPGIRVGAGTVCSAEQVKLAGEAGAQFLVSPGATDRLLDALQGSELPFLAGTATPSDMLRLLERGITEAKLFPATAVGGAALLRAVAGPLPQLRFCPTGGITFNTAREYLSLPNVGCVGGTWLAPKSLVESGDWAAISRLAAEAAALR
ncbi:MAG TPA: bifunctional 4-hydroxy-2-oxoglutarate aldolase/2-dehydro-3-deoxy-phosphogluconate aldolase [Jatrophihabitantaceae bacterium]|jgi:2-dehydro-3-deoxyphosphogluconate aldolase/(4S)-4-hydroxy-2-oxoglutarate aldolase